MSKIFKWFYICMAVPLFIVTLPKLVVDFASLSKQRASAGWDVSIFTYMDIAIYAAFMLIAVFFCIIAIGFAKLKTWARHLALASNAILLIFFTWLESYIVRHLHGFRENEQPMVMFYSIVILVFVAMFGYVTVVLFRYDSSDLPDDKK